MATIKVTKNIDSYTCHRNENCNLREFYIHVQFYKFQDVDLFFKSS